MSLVVSVLTPSGKGTLIGVPSVTVELVGKVKVKTDKRGQAVIAKLEPGVYDLKVRDEAEHPQWVAWYDEKATEFWYHKHVEALKKAGRPVDEDLSGSVAGVRVKAGASTTVSVWLLDRSTALGGAAAAAGDLAKLQVKHSLTIQGASLAERIYAAADTARAARTMIEDTRGRYAAAGGSLNSVAELATILKTADPVHRAYYSELEQRCRAAAKKVYDVVGGKSYHTLVEKYEGPDRSLVMQSRRMGEWIRAVALIVTLIESAHNIEVADAVCSHKDPLRYHDANSRLLPYYWQQTATKASAEGVDVRMLLDVAVAFALQEVLNAPFAGANARALFDRGANDGAAEAPGASEPAEGMIGKIQKYFRQFVEGASGVSAPAANVVGNLPGPPSLWVVLTQHRALKMVQAAAKGGAPAAEVGRILADLNKRMPAHARLSASDLDALQKGLLETDRAKVTESVKQYHGLVGETVHASPRAHGLMTLLQLILTASAYYKITSVSAQADEKTAIENLNAYMSLVVPMVNAAAAAGTGVVTTVVALTASHGGLVVRGLRSTLPHLASVAGFGALGGLVAAVVAYAALPPHASAYDRFFGWVDITSASLGSVGVIVGFASGVVAAKFFAAGAIIGVVSAGVKMAFEASYTGVTKVILARVDNVGQDPVLRYLVKGLAEDCKAILDIDVANRWQFGKSFRPDKHDLQRLKGELMFDEANEINVMVVP